MDSKLSCFSYILMVTFLLSHPPFNPLSFISLALSSMLRTRCSCFSSASECCVLYTGDEKKNLSFSVRLWGDHKKSSLRFGASETNLIWSVGLFIRFKYKIAMFLK